jgi:hypothetical protein
MMLALYFAMQTKRIYLLRVKLPCSGYAARGESRVTEIAGSRPRTRARS